MAYRFAQRTKVTSDASRSEIERFLRKREVSEYISGFTEREASIQFCVRGLRVRMTLPLIEVERQKPVRISDREERARWRALLLVLKAKFAAIDSKVTTLEIEFLPYLVVESTQRTVYQEISAHGLGRVLDGKQKLLASVEE
jgi:hypothetical protein